MKIILKTISCLCLSFSLCGCVEKEVLDDIILIEGIGFDSSENENIKVTVGFPIYLKDQKPLNQTFSAESPIKKMALQDIQRHADEPIVTGSVEVVLFEKELAEKEGILDLVDTLQRDPGIGAGIHLAIVDGKTKDFLKGEYGIRGNATYISKLIEHNIKSEDLPTTNLQRFLSDFYKEGKTTYLPLLKQLGRDKIKLTGVSLFKYGKVVDFITPKDMFFFKLLVDKFSEGLYRVKIDEGEAAIRSIRSSHNFELTKRNPMEVTIHIKVEGIVNEFTGENLTAKKKEQLEEQFEKDINEKCHKMIQRFQEKQLDPIGLGHFVKTQTRNFDFQEWKETQYKDLVVKVQSDVTITETGVIQ